MQRKVIAAAFGALASLSLVFACVGEDTTSSERNPDGAATQTDSPVGPSDAGGGDVIVVAVDADAATFCQQFPPGTACEDFERGEPELHGWVRDDRQDGGGGIEIVTTSGTDNAPSRVARLKLRAHDKTEATASSRFGQIITNPSTTNAWTIEADVRIVERNAPFGDLSILGFFYDDQSTKLAALYLTDGKVTGERFAQPFADQSDGGQGSGNPFLIPYPNTWVHIVMRIERGLTTSKLTIKLGTTELSTIDGLTVPEAQHKINIGPASTETTGTVTIEVDNFVVRTE